MDIPANEDLPPFPVGGKSVADGGQGIFYDEAKDENIEVWLDLDILRRAAVIQRLEVSVVPLSIRAKPTLNSEGAGKAFHIR